MTAKRRGLVRSPFQCAVRCAIVARDESNDERTLAHTSAGVDGRTNRDARSRAADWNGPQVQLAQGRLCRTAEKRFGDIAGNGSLPQRARRTNEVMC
jgi:hypothetical protein